MEMDLDILGIGFSPHFAEDATTDGMIPANGTLFRHAHVSGVHKVSNMVGSRRGPDQAMLRRGYHAT